MTLAQPYSKIYTETDYKKQHKIHQTLRTPASAGRMSQLPSAGQQLGSNRVGKNRKETHGQKQNARTSLKSMWQYLIKLEDRPED